MPHVWFYNDGEDDQLDQALSGSSKYYEMSRVPNINEQVRIKGKLFKVVRVIHVLDDDYDASVEIQSFYEKVD